MHEELGLVLKYVFGSHKIFWFIQFMQSLKLLKLNVVAGAAAVAFPARVQKMENKGIVGAF